MIGQTLVFDQSQPIARLEEDNVAHGVGQTASASYFRFPPDVQSFGTPSFAWTKDGFVAFFSATGTSSRDV